MEGFELKDSVVSVYSCSDYGNAGNKSCMLHAMKNEDIIPKILNPTGGKDRWLNLDDSSRKITNQE